MDVDWGEVNVSLIIKKNAMMLGITGLFARQLPLRLFRDPDGLPYYFTDFSKVHRLQLPASSAHISIIAFDTQQELLWTGDEMVGISLLFFLSNDAGRAIRKAPDQNA